MQEHSCSISDSLTNFCIVVGCIKNHSITNKHCFSDTKSLSDNILQRRYILILHECTNRAVVRCSFQKESVTWITWGRVICTSSRDPLNQLQMIKEKGRLDRYTMAPSSSSGTLISTLSSCINCCWKYNVCWSTGTSNFWRMAVFKSATVSSYRIKLSYVCAQIQEHDELTFPTEMTVSRWTSPEIQSLHDAMRPRVLTTPHVRLGGTCPP